MLTQGGDERRQGPRVDFDTEVTVSAEGHEIKYKGSSRDISLRGIFVRTDKQITVGAGCYVEIRLIGAQDDIVLKMDGHVVRSEDEGVAVYFDSVDLDSYSHLKNIVKYNASDSENETI